MSWWITLTEGQGAVIAALMTIVAAVVGVLLGWFLFGGKVKTLSEAVEHSEAVLQEHKTTTATLLSEIVQQVTSTLEATNTLRGQIADQAATTVESESVTEGEYGEGPSNSYEGALVEGESPPISKDEFRSRMVDAWDAIRAEIERVASDPQVDGRTRAKYGRIDRRSYWKLIESLGVDGTMPSDKYDLIYKAYDIWMRHRSGRPVPILDDLEKIEGIRRMIAPQA